MPVLLKYGCAIAMIIVHAPNQSDRQNQKQNLAPTRILTSVKP
ncbi:hypothetical protein COO91_05968 [Nostoc flagelliforme CCNUN1]|uniref:Uncharacterized protein n=1 Tax=Nostoc flagelliforme CCNUN1 TaxID=2038116 RepID=A0A2K8SX08_9NOSO|nr:hypothetical protein [Nostoc flagelliforme]AUB39972.1 hypothetical protein COO91_05968 [Nostoc flagelliforme CCNUN1]